MQKRPQHLSFKEIHQIMGSILQADMNKAFLSSEFVMVKDSSIVSNLIAADVPYIIEDVRIGIVVCGKAKATINLIDYEVSKGNIIIFHYGTIIQLRQVSADFVVTGVMLDSGLLSHVIGDSQKATMHSDKGVTIIKPTQEELTLVTGMLDNLWQITRIYGFQRNLIISSLKLYIGCIELIANKDKEGETTSKEYANVTFRKFIELVNKHSARERNIDFYADQLYLSGHYLGTVIKKASGMTPKEWIDKSIITQAKAMLKSTDLQVAQISLRLGFPNPSFFNKYFKRLTGMTPQQYRVT